MFLRKTPYINQKNFIKKSFDFRSCPCGMILGIGCGEIALLVISQNGI